MEADYHCFELVFVIGGHKLIDAESYERRYRSSDGALLTSGYYVVNWPEEVRARRFNELARFHGPFESRPEAQFMLDLMAATPRIAAVPRKEEAVPA